jgi:hypothetical protein
MKFSIGNYEINLNLWLIFPLVVGSFIFSPATYSSSGTVSSTNVPSPTSRRDANEVLSFKIIEFGRNGNMEAHFYGKGLLNASPVEQKYLDFLPALRSTVHTSALNFYLLLEQFVRSDIEGQVRCHQEV